MIKELPGFSQSTRDTRDIVLRRKMASLASASVVSLGAFSKASGLRRSEVRPEFPLRSREEKKKREEKVHSHVSSIYYPILESFGAQEDGRLFSRDIASTSRLTRTHILSISSSSQFPNHTAPRHRRSRPPRRRQGCRRSSPEGPPRGTGVLVE